MKYIRTKDRLYCINDIGFDENSANKTVFGIYKPDCSVIYKRNINGQADTIEELCDEFVGISDGKPQMLRFVPYACAQYWNGGVYGAVWTDKGLIYVAKINEKGELELL